MIARELLALQIAKAICEANIPTIGAIFPWNEEKDSYEARKDLIRAAEIAIETMEARGLVTFPTN